MNADLTKKVAAYISRHQLMTPGGKYLVALSGGADSVFLLLIMKELSFVVEAVHCNFRLRGEESERDELFCRTLCEQQHVPLHLAHFDTRSYAQLHGQSIELAARHLRYHYFAQLAADLHAEGLCTGHHRDDSVETTLLNMIRGTGLRGLTGIAPKVEMKLTAQMPVLQVIRPLLCLTHEEMKGALQAACQPWVDDSTNFHPDEATRNFIRLRLLPLMSQANPSASANIARMSDHLSQASQLLDFFLGDVASRCMKDEPHGFSIDFSLFEGLPAPQYVLHFLLRDAHFSSLQLDEIWKNRHSGTGLLFGSSTHELLIDRGRFLVEPKGNAPLVRLKIPEPGNYVMDENHTLFINKKDTIADALFLRDHLREPQLACVDAEKVAFPLMLRTIENGDTFTPYGMKGHRLVSDYLTDLHVNRFEKRRQLVVADAKGRIVWMVNRRVDDHYKITPETRSFFVIQLSERKSHGV